jgi:hypothetical protein
MVGSTNNNCQRQIRAFQKKGEERLLKRFTKRKPATNPPTWAIHATPEAELVATIPLNIWITIHPPSSTTADRQMKAQNILKNMNARIQALGWRSKYAPRVPATAPLAPTMGIVEPGANCRVKIWMEKRNHWMHNVIFGRQLKGA